MRSDLVINLIKTGIEGDQPLFRKTVEALAAEERSKQHHVIADRIMALLDNRIAQRTLSLPTQDPVLQDAFFEQVPQRPLSDLILPDQALEQCQSLVEEHQRRDLLRSYNLEPRHRILLSGPPGNGKTSLAEAIAHDLMVPIFHVRYEGLVASHLGETAKRLDRLFEHVKGQRCVLFFDEFDALGKERDDVNEVGEIKRIVNALLLQLDKLPSHVVFIAATNHPNMLDKAAWRRFQLQIDLPKPDKVLRKQWLSRFVERVGHDFGYTPSHIAQQLSDKSFAEIEDFALDVQRRYVLDIPNADVKKIVKALLDT